VKAVSGTILRSEVVPQALAPPEVQTYQAGHRMHSPSFDLGAYVMAGKFGWFLVNPKEVGRRDLRDESLDAHLSQDSGSPVTHFYRNLRSAEGTAVSHGQECGLT
jgi:hypothetical protein